VKRIVVGEDDRVGPWVCARVGGYPWVKGEATTVGLEHNGELVAGVTYDRWNGVSLMMHVASDGSKRWLNRRFLWFCFHYPFDQLGAKKVIGTVEATNHAALAFDKHLGFIEEGRLKDACPGGDLILLTMTPEQCRYIRHVVKGVENDLATA